ncbi:iron uptake porin [Leptolyngbya sp. NK1-12]|uniref:Iron uptake porin n=1 Tax=Leptolyngbya sp. NK1-12 TaxID=2547451 RepID=A0AA96WP36_9CYAN|nr:iron uptake porin [Leptolyngbya sp. NK1-12]WNZ25691.1 iron uptake porin [Leptolyngbya sp. NK1-12]
MSFKFTEVAVAQSTVAQSRIVEPDFAPEQVIDRSEGMPIEDRSQESGFPERQPTGVRSQEPEAGSVVAVDGAMGGQVTSVSQLSDVQPTDWAYQALQLLIENYGCLVGYPDQLFRGNRALTRYEFAAGLNACLNRMQQLLATELERYATRAELAVVERLMSEFAAELAALQSDITNLEQRFANLQSASTLRLQGETIFAISEVLAGDEEGLNNPVLQSRTNLTFDASFSGEDRLRATLEFGNFERFMLPESTNEGRLSFATGTDEGEIGLDTLSYEFPAGEDITVLAIAKGGNLNDFITNINPLSSSGTATISRFGQRNPIYRGSGFDVGTGIGANIFLLDDLSIEVGYIAANSSNPSLGNGLFNGGYGVIGQITATPEPLELSLTYAHSYVPDGGNSTGTGSIPATVEVEYTDAENTRPVVVNSYGLGINYAINDGFQLGGWVGHSAVRAIGLGDADVWNYAVHLSFPDLGGEGNLGGIIVGMEPRLSGTTPGLGAALGRRRDLDVGLHVEGFYRIALSDNLSITPGLIWLTAPNHNAANPDVLLGTIRTTFRF